MTEKIIKDFLNQISTQDNRGTAYPYFYVIRTEVKKPAPDYDCDGTTFYWEGDEWDSKEELEFSLKECGYDEAEKKRIREEVRECPYKKEWEHRCMFLTEQDASDHLKANHYHYSHNAHTYICHAWRAPQLKEFFDALFKHFGVERLKG